jgi:hypothetical protein
MKATVDENAWLANKDIRHFVLEGDAYHFWLRGRTDTCTAMVSGSEIEIFPERSSGQRRLASVLGLTI